MACGLDNIKIRPMKVIWGGTDLGLTDGDIEFTMEEQMHELTAHQSGTEVRDNIRTGKNVELSVTLKETSSSQMAFLLAVGGGESVAATEVTDITCVAETGSNLGGKYFLIHSALDANKYQVWFDVNNASTAPATLTGYTLTEVDVATSATASAVATALQAVLDPLAGLNASVVGSVVTVTNVSSGATTDATAETSPLTISVTTQGAGVHTGWGISKRYGSAYDDSQLLNLHPVGNTDTDYSEDFAFWKAYLMPESITFSGENPETVSVTFKVFPDCSRQDEIQYFAYGTNK